MTKIGMLFLTGEWLEKIGANKGFFSSLPQILKRDILAIKESLPEGVEIIDSGMVNSREKAVKATELFKKRCVDIIMICYLTWGEDWLFFEVIKRLPDTPLLLWNYLPSRKLPSSFDMVQLFRFSGPVGAVQASGPLKRMGRQFGVISGSTENEKTVEEIRKCIKAAGIIAKLKNLTIGLLPSVCDGMSGTYIEDNLLKQQLGISVKPITVKEYHRISESVPGDRISRYAELLKGKYKVEVTDKALYKNIRASVGLLEIVRKYNLQALAFNDLDEQIHQTFGIRPCLCIPGLFEKTVISMEGDVGAAVALYILKELTDKSPMYTEIFTFDEEANIFLAGHAGIHDINLAESEKDIRIIPDYEYMEVEKDTASMQFKAKSGRVTMLNIFFDGKEFQMSAIKGKITNNRKRFDISPYMYIKPDRNVNELMKKIIQCGITQHWAVVHQDVIEDLQCLKDTGININLRT